MKLNNPKLRELQKEFIRIQKIPLITEQQYFNVFYLHFYIYLFKMLYLQ